MKVNNNVVYKVTSQRRTQLFTSYVKAVRVVNRERQITPPGWVKSIQEFAPGELQEMIHEGDPVEWVNKATQRFIEPVYLHLVLSPIETGSEIYLDYEPIAQNAVSIARFCGEEQHLKAIGACVGFIPQNMDTENMIIDFKGLEKELTEIIHFNLCTSKNFV